MNNCQRCSKIVRSKKYCPSCNKLFCSDFCLKHHINISHLNEKYAKQSNDSNINNNNIYSNNSSIISDANNNSFTNKTLSPFITKGNMTLGKVLYDDTFSLKNFKPVLENGRDKVIGSGAYGKVFLAINKSDKKYYAIKHMIKKDLYKALKTLKGIYTEIDIQSRINHPNIIRLLYVKERSESFDLVMEYAKYGNLYSYIKKHSYLTEERSFKFFIQVVNAIYFLHKNDLIHRDIKPENILLFENCVKLCDFGWCTRLDGGNRGTFCGTAEYMSPEMVNKEEYSKDIDIWSLGILLYEMIHGNSPFKPNKSKFNINDIMNNIKIQNLKFNEKISKECKELIIHLLDRDVTKRYKIDDIFNSKFVKHYENLYFPKTKNMSLTTRKIEKDNNNHLNDINKNKDFETLDNNFIYTKHIINNNNNSNIDEDFQRNNCKIKNKTARNFYPSQLKREEKEKEIEHNANNNNNNNNLEKTIIIKKNNNEEAFSKYGSYCKVKKTENKFDSARYISQDNLLNFFKKPKSNNVKEKVLTNNNSISTPNLIKNNEINNSHNNIININANSKQNLTLKKNSFNQSLTQRNLKYSTQTVKNKNISIDLNNININKQMNYTNRSKNNTIKTKSRLNSCENYQKKLEKKPDEYLIENIDERRQPLITDINEEVLNNNMNYFNNNENTINSRVQYNKKVKIKSGINLMNNNINNNINNINNNEEIKIITDNFINANTGKIRTKVKNYYRSNTNLRNKIDINPAQNPQINIINNNHIYNNNIVKYSFFSKGKKNVKVKENILSYHKSANNNGIILLINKDKKDGVYPIKKNRNKDNNEEDEQSENIKDLDETPKKEIDIVKIMPNVLINNFNKELNGFLKSE